ncbi:hypothetical protein V6N12_050742 [Hibiscus sabdariffa]|uniref:Dirigent protein n=1 Tax=Hibiscus sabdariffa TaxID=183260 RepID=A0ABR2GDA7_9ROSI
MTLVGDVSVMWGDGSTLGASRHGHSLQKHGVLFGNASRVANHGVSWWVAASGHQAEVNLSFSFANSRSMFI